MHILLILLQGFKGLYKNFNLLPSEHNYFLYAEVFSILMEIILISPKNMCIFLNSENNKIQTVNCLLQI